MKKSVVTFFAGFAGYVPFVFAGTKTHQDPGTLFYILAGIVLSVLIYTANKWRLWGLGFKFGMASKSTFLSSVKWTGLSLVVTCTSLLVLFKFG